MSTEITVFKQFETDLATLEESNAGMEFPDTPDGIDERRKWYRKLRKGTNALDKIRKEAGAEYLRLKREVDAEAKTIQVRLDVMELPHKIVLDDIEAALQKEIDDLAEKNRLQAEYEEDERLAWLDYRERKAQAIIDADEQAKRDKKAEIDAINAKVLAGKKQKDAVDAALAQVEQDKKDVAAKVIHDANELAKQVAFDAAQAHKKAEQEKQDAIAEEKAKAHQADNDRIAKELEEKNKQDELDRKEAKRKADLVHQTLIKKEIMTFLAEFLGDNDHASAVVTALDEGIIPHVTINY